MRQPKADSDSNAESTSIPADLSGCEMDAENGTLESGTPVSRCGSSRDAAIEPESTSVPQQANEEPLANADSASESRLHITSLWLPLLETLLGVIVPGLVASLFIGLGNVIFFIGCFGLLPVGAYHALRYFTFQYRLTGTELVIHSGVVFRRERRIPFDRVQEIEIHQGLVHRLLDLAKLQIKTAGSDAQEADLNVLSKQAAETLKEEIDARRRDTSVQRSHEGISTDDPPDFVCELTIRDLLLGGLTSRLVASLGALVAAIVYFQLFLNVGASWFGEVERNLDDRVEQRWPGQDAMGNLAERIESQTPDIGPLNSVVDFIFSDTLPKSVSLVFWGLAASVVAYMIRYHGFRLTRRGDLLSTSYGLLTFRRGSLSVHRIQALKLEEDLLRRWCGLAAVRVDSAGDRNEIQEAKKRDVLVPVASTKTAHEVARQAIPGLTELEPTWQRISPLAIMRGSKKGWLLMFVAMLQTYGIAGWLFFIWLPAIPIVYFLNYQWYRHTGYWFDDDHFLGRKGWLNRETVCLPIKNIQNVSVTQSFFDRRLHLATLSIDTAGQSNTGGGPVIRHLPVQKARNIQQALASRAAACEFEW